MSDLAHPIQSWTILVCSTCGGTLHGRTCENGHNAFPGKKIEVVEKSELDALIKFTSAAIDLLPERHRKVIVADMKARLAE